MNKIPLVDLKAQYETIKPEVDAAIQGVIDRTGFILGEPVVPFEQAFAAYCSAQHAVGVNSARPRSPCLRGQRHRRR